MHKLGNQQELFQLSTHTLMLSPITKLCLADNCGEWASDAEAKDFTSRSEVHFTINTQDSLFITRCVHEDSNKAVLMPVYIPYDTKRWTESDDTSAVLW